jgi:hypothetical protein
MYRSCRIPYATLHALRFVIARRLFRRNPWHVAAMVVTIIGLTACAPSSPIAPTSAPHADVPMVDHAARIIETCGDGSTCADHNIPAIALDGMTVVWVCRTQPRAYTTRDGITTWEHDHYISTQSCPTTPID